MGDVGRQQNARDPPLPGDLRHEPTKPNRSRVKRLKKLSQPQYRLRLGEVRVFYDASEENDPRFLDRVERARASLRAGRGVRLEDVKSWVERPGR